MPGLSLFSQSFCNSRMVVRRLADKIGGPVITDQDILTRAALLSDIPETKISRLFVQDNTAFNLFTLERKSALAHIKLAIAEQFMEEDPILTGYCSAILPPGLSGIVKVAITASRTYRLGRAKSFHRLSGAQAAADLESDDKNKAAWIRDLSGDLEPWRTDLYDIFISMDHSGPGRASELILDHIKENPCVSRSGIADFCLEAQVSAALISRGHDVLVRVTDGRVCLGITRQVLMRGRLEAELASIVERIQEGVPLEIVESNMPNSKLAGRETPGEIPTRVLLVDDEREFVQTLSERLQIRGIASSVAFDGASALDQILKKTPEVMVIDLKMPGIDGLELLRRVKARYADIQVIVLTGHGSDQDREKCLASGAFAYFQKPVDIDVLKDNLISACARI